MNIYDEILNSSPTFDGVCRYELSTPFVFNDYVATTNGHIIIRIKQELLEGDYEAKSNTPKLDRCFDLPSLKKPIALPIKFNAKNLVQYADRFTNCVDCNGKGYLGRKKDKIDCDCEKGKTENIVRVDFDGQQFSMKYLVILKEIATKLKSKIYRTKEVVKNVHVFQIGEVEIALMPLADMVYRM